MALPRKVTTKIYEIKAHNGNVTSLDLGETGSVLVTGGQDRNVKLWAIGTEKCFMTLPGHNRPIDCVRFACNDDYVYSADDIGIIRRWDLNSQTICSTLNGHMKSVRTLDFNPSSMEYVVSGSNDTTIRLWDVRNQNKCIKIYRGHISHVNSVKFSPDGLWIASAGTEGTVIIWDIRKSKPIMEFMEKPPGAAITCIQFHPFEFLLAVGRIDGTVSIYDLERQVRISNTSTATHFYGHPIKCITFSESGECLFVGTAVGISVIGWEPDRDFDHVQSTWTTLADMKVVNTKLILGSHENDAVAISAININRLFPFFNPSNIQQPAFSHNSTTRKSFSRGNQNLRLSIAATRQSQLVEENEDSQSPSLDDQSSPNLSFELVDESIPLSTSTPPFSSVGSINGHSSSNNNNTNTNNNLYNDQKILQPIYNLSSYNSLGGYAEIGSNSLKVAGQRDIYDFESLGSPNSIEAEYNMNNPPIISNYEHTEMLEDFPVNLPQQNIGSGPPASGGGGGSTATNNLNQHAVKSTRTRTTSIHKRNSHISLTNNANKGSLTSSFQQRGRLAQTSSISSTDLHKLDDNMLLKKSSSSQFVVSKGKRAAANSADHQQTVSNVQRHYSSTKENTRNKNNSNTNSNITVQIYAKPPARSRTTLDLRSSSSATASSALQRQTRISNYISQNPNEQQQQQHHQTTNVHLSQYRPDASLLAVNQKNFQRNDMDNSEIQMLSASHEQVYQELSNRHATLQLIRNSTRSHDIVGALRQAIKINGRAVFVDLLGAIIEKTSSWNLDLCLLLLPEIYELLQSQHKFYYTRACDTLRVILSNFLPIIQENIDPWAANGLGVDVTREERQRKCLECQRWLLQIRNLPESVNFGTTTTMLTQLQNMIVNI